MLNSPSNHQRINYSCDWNLINIKRTASAAKLEHAIFHFRSNPTQQFPPHWLYVLRLKWASISLIDDARIFKFLENIYMVFHVQTKLIARTFFVVRQRCQYLSDFIKKVSNYFHCLFTQVKVYRCDCISANASAVTMFSTFLSSVTL